MKTGFLCGIKHEPNMFLSMLTIFEIIISYRVNCEILVSVSRLVLEKNCNHTKKNQIFLFQLESPVKFVRLRFYKNYENQELEKIKFNT